jgi:Flp pilus assembly protein TadG
MTPRRRRAGRERGAVLVEAAFVLPIFITFMFGLVEYGLMAHAETDLNWSARTATLDLARNYEHELVDADVLRDVALEYSGAERSTILGVMVFRAESDGTATAACDTALQNLVSTSTTAAGVVDWCNVYSGTVVTAVAAGTGATVFGADCTGADRFFCPTERADLFTGTNGIGVTIRVQHTNLTGLLPFMTRTLSESAVMLPIR